MTTPFDSDTAHNDGIGAQPSDAQALYHILERDGADWQISIAPGVGHINQRLRARVAQLHTAQAPDRASTSLVSASAPSSAAPPLSPAAPTGQRPPRSPHLRRWVTTFAAVAVVTAFVAALALNAAHRPGVSSHLTTASASPTSASAPTGWISLSRLNYVTSSSANDVPAIAPSDPNDVYETMAAGIQQGQPAIMRMTSDGGATWRTLKTPVPASHLGYAGIGVSPIDPQTAFLYLIDNTASDCPANRLEQGAGSGQICRMQYTTTDGGASWSVTGLPLASGSKPGWLAASVSGGTAQPMMSNTVRAQGQRLFAGFICTDYSCSRLVTSMDGGRTWSFADQGMLAAGAANVCDYTTSAVGTTLYAVTTASICDPFNSQAPLTLWRSVDSGATWVKVTGLATPNERGMELTQNPTTGATLLYMGMPRTSKVWKDPTGHAHPTVTSSPNDVRVSTDGGATWQSAPTAGIPTGYEPLLDVDLLGTLRDGSVVIDVVPLSAPDPNSPASFKGSDLYAWKPGDTGWRLIAKGVPREFDSLLIRPSPSGTGDSLYTVLVNRRGFGPDTFMFIKQDNVR